MAEYNFHESLEFNVMKRMQTSVKFQINDSDKAMSFEEVFRMWRDDDAFTLAYVAFLNSLKFNAFYWEHPPLRITDLARPYECLVIESSTLDRLGVNEKAFSNYIHSISEVTDFENLGGDAHLVVPCKKSEEQIYNHFSKFLNGGDRKQIIAFFSRIGELIEGEIENRSQVWLNTAGMGVIWLHVRMDAYPKYYKTMEYKDSDYFTK